MLVVDLIFRQVPLELEPITSTVQTAIRKGFYDAAMFSIYQLYQPLKLYQRGFADKFMELFNQVSALFTSLLQEHTLIGTNDA